MFAQIISSAKMGNALSQKVKMGQSYLSNEKVLSYGQKNMHMHHFKEAKLHPRLYFGCVCETSDQLN